LQLLQKIYCKLVTQDRTIYKNDKEKQTMELEQLNKEVVLKNKEKVHRETNLKDLSTRVTNKSC